MKKLLFTLIAVLLPMLASAYDAQIDGIYYDFDETAKTATVTYQKINGLNSYYYYSDYSGNVTIPSEVTYNSQQYTVTSIGMSAFYRCSGLKSVTIPNSVTSINEDAFYRCSGLISINIPDGVTYIGLDAFNSCSGLTSINIPDGVTIASRAFWDCSKLVVFCGKKTPPSAQKNTFNTGLAMVPPDVAQAYRTATGWKNLKIESAYGIDVTQTTITFTATLEGFSILSVKFDEQVLIPVEEGKVKITGLNPNKKYDFSISGKYGDINLEHTITWQTKTVSLSGSVKERTNLTATLIGSYDAGDATVTKHGFDGFDDNEDEVTIHGLAPGNSYSRTYYVECGENCRFRETIYFTTTPIDINIDTAIGATSCSLTGSYSVIDATVTGFGFTDKPDLKIMTIKGLDPNTSYSYSFYVDTKEGGRVFGSTKIKTKALVFATQQPKVVSVGNVIIAADSNLDDEEENVGFEWRRTDWTNDFASNTGGAALFEGRMEGYIRNMNAEKLWKYRPYYLSNSGTYYYGDWVGIDPSNTSYFEPTVHTYEKTVIEGNTALVKGYALTGTDKITVQGFKYWRRTSKARGESPVSIPSDAMTIEASGQVMTASLTDLDFGATYNYLSFVTTSEGETFYGELKEFTTDEAEKIGDVNSDGEENAEDIVVITNFIMGKAVDVTQEKADVNGDGVVNIADVIQIVNIIAGQ